MPDTERNRIKTDMRSQVRRLANNAVALGMGGAVAQLAFTLLEVLVARELGAEAYGVFVTAYVWTVFGMYLMDFGTSLYSVQEGSRDRGRIPGLLGSGLVISLVVFFTLYSILALVAIAFSPTPVLGILLILFPYGLILAVQNDLAAVYASYQTMRVNAWYQGVAPLAILILYFAFAADGLTLTDVGFTYVIGGAVVTGVWTISTLRWIGSDVTLEGIRSTVRSSYQYGLTGILGHVYFKADIVMLTALAGLREAGIYAAAFKLVELVFKGAVLVGRVFAPAVFKAHHESAEAFGKLAGMLVRLLTIAGLAAGISVVLLADDLILLIFGERYASSAPILRILGGVIAAKCMAIALQLLLSSGDLHFRRVANMSIALTVHIAANAFLIPRLGAEGAAWAALLSSILLAVLHAWSSASQRSFRLLRWLLLPSCMAAAIVALAVWLGLRPVPATVVSVGVFVAGVYFSGVVKRNEIDFLLRSLVTRREGSQQGTQPGARSQPGE
jgi:O-antigen/teichoic acid export membrane protein